MTLPSYRVKNLTLVTAIGVVVVYVVLLLFTTRIAQDQLRDRALNQVTLSLEKQAAALSYFYEERRDDLINLRKNPAILNYFVNKDLGMSMRYGLRASLVQMEDLLKEVKLNKRIEGAPVYLRIAVFDRFGQLLAAAGLPQIADQPRWTQAAGDESIEIRMQQSASHRDLLLVTGIPYKNEMTGTLVAWINHELAFARLTTSEEANRRARFIVGYEETILNLAGRRSDALDENTEQQLARLLNRGSSVPTSDHLGPGLLGVYTPVPNTLFWLVGLYPTDESLGMLSSAGFFNSLVIVALVILAGTVFLVRANTKNLVLRARLEEGKRQEAVLSEKNAKLEEEISRRHEYERRLVYQANFDQLTGLPNRVLAIDRLSQAIEQANRVGKHVLLVFADLDRFKQVNDSLGHSAGDQLLIHAADRLRQGVRASDTVARFGGDEFVLICPGMSNVSAAQLVAENLLKTFAEPFYLNGHELHVSTSLGLALYPLDGTDAMSLLKNADTALYKAKDGGRSTFCFFTRSMNDEMQERMLMETHLRNAIKCGELTLLYQPLVRVGNGDVIGFEALLRWCSKELGEVPPSRFIPLAEESGLIEDIGTWVLNEACRDAQQWQAIKPVKVAVNVSSRQMRASDKFSATVKAALNTSGLSAGLLELEITENMLLEDLPKVTRLMRELDRLGVRLALDDFGTGYSALSYLKHLPFDVLKIDRSFVQDSVNDIDNGALVHAILAMAQALRMEVVGEGVETAEQADYLRTHHCDFAQGFYFSRPMASEQVPSYLAGWLGRPSPLYSTDAPAWAPVPILKRQNRAIGA